MTLGLLLLNLKLCNSISVDLKFSDSFRKNLIESSLFNHFRKWSLHLCALIPLSYCAAVVHILACVLLLTGDGVGKAVRMFGNEGVLDVPPTNSMST